MLGLYFSGTGNSRYALEVFLKKYCTDARIFAIEDEKAPGKVRKNEEIIFSYSVQYSSIPKMLYDFITRNQTLWQGKRFLLLRQWGCSAVTAQVFWRGFCVSTVRRLQAGCTCVCRAAAVFFP